MKNIHSLRLLLFFVLLAVFAYCSPQASPFQSTLNPQTLLYAWFPGIAALVVAVITKFPLRNFGWNFSLKWVAIACLIPILYTSLAYSLCWVFGLASFPNPGFAENINLAFGGDGTAFSILLAFIYTAVIQLIPNMLLFMGAELGWRGFLLPELTKLTSFHNAGWISGVIWLLWYLPYLLSASNEVDDIPKWYQIFCFTILLISLAIILSYLRIKSKSIWPPVIFHAVHNSIIYNFFEKITLDNGMSSLFVGEFGIILASVTSLFALYFYFSFKKIDLLRFESN